MLTSPPLYFLLVIDRKRDSRYSWSPMAPDDRSTGPSKSLDTNEGRKERPESHQAHRRELSANPRELHPHRDACPLRRGRRNAGPFVRADPTETDIHVWRSSPDSTRRQLCRLRQELPFLHDNKDGESSLSTGSLH